MNEAFVIKRPLGSTLCFFERLHAFRHGVITHSTSRRKQESQLNLWTEPWGIWANLGLLEGPLCDPCWWGRDLFLVLFTSLTVTRAWSRKVFSHKSFVPPTSWSNLWRFHKFPFLFFARTLLSLENVILTCLFVFLFSFGSYPEPLRPL